MFRVAKPLFATSLYKYADKYDLTEEQEKAIYDGRNDVLAEAYNSFKELDVGEDGYIDRQDLRDYNGTEDPNFVDYNAEDDFFNKIDMNEDQRISIDEWLMWNGKVYDKSTEFFYDLIDSWTKK